MDIGDFQTFTFVPHPLLAPTFDHIRRVCRDYRDVFGRNPNLLRPRRFNLAHAVLHILEDPRWRRDAGAHGPAFVSKRFGQERMIDETIAFYRPSRASIFGCANHFLSRLRSNGRRPSEG